MKRVLFALFIGCTSAACSEISTDPAPARQTRTAERVEVRYNLTTGVDTLLANPKLEVYTYPVTTNSDGSTSTPNSTGNLVATITNFTSPQPIVLSSTPIVVTENAPGPLGIRLVLSSTNRPGRRSVTQRLNASIVVNGVSRSTTTLQGTNFTRTARPTNGFFTASTQTNISGLIF